MAFDFLAHIANLLTSVLAYVIAMAVFWDGLQSAAVYFAALIALGIVIFVLRILFSPKGKGLLHAMAHETKKGKSIRKVMLGLKESMEREIISSSVARVFAFCTIMFLFSGNMLIVYVAAIAAGAIGLIMMMAHRNHLIDIIGGGAIGAGIGFCAYRFVPLLLPF